MIKAKHFVAASLFALIITIIVGSCKKSEAPIVSNYTGKIPFTAQNSTQIGNLHNLGRTLFYDNYLSFNNTISCGTCHLQNKSFSSAVRFDKGIGGNTLTRNTPAIFGNDAFLFWDGRSKSLSDLVLKPVASHAEMMQDLEMLPSKLEAISYYPQLFKTAFGSNDNKITLQKIQLALEKFCKSIGRATGSSKFMTALENSGNAITLVANSSSGNVQNSVILISSGMSKSITINFDKVIGISSEEKLGAKLFFGKAKCSNCHDVISTEPSGGGGYGNIIPDSGQTTNESRIFKNIGLDYEYVDKGLAKLTGKKSDNGKFRLPLLFNLQYTAPYMHDGRFNTLEEVIEHYNTGVIGSENLSEQLCEPNSFKRGIISPLQLNLTNEEVKALVTFLRTLSNDKALTNS